MSEAILTHYSVERLHEFSARVFTSCGVPEDQARSAASVLTRADLWGIESHGVAAAPGRRPARVVH
jgi:LDH2 family malate/lactate/ureidoglycolate dehydrogenase